MKVDYLTLGDARSVAYLDQQLTSHPKVWIGSDKYTDQMVFVESSSAGWYEVKGEVIINA